MKKIISLSSFFLIAIIAIIIIGFANDAFLSSNDNSNSTGKQQYNKTTVNKSNRISEVIALKKMISKFDQVDLFTYSKQPKNRRSLNSFTRAASSLKLGKQKLEQFINSAKQNIVFRIPMTEGKYMELELTQQTVISPDFELASKSLSGEKQEQYTPGIYYRGIIKGDENSIASISVFENNVIGIMSNANGNYVLGRVKGDGNSFNEDYIFYNDADLLVSNDFKCHVDDYDAKFVRALTEVTQDIKNYKNGDNSDQATLPVKMYFEADYQMYLDNNSSVTEVGNTVTGIFNSVKTLYFNENIPMEIKKIAAWTSTDPYAYLNDSYSILVNFGGRTQDEFEGNLAHLLSTRNENFGGIAWVRVLCMEYSAQDSAGRFAFSNIETSYINYPTYSWTVSVITHETGHNLGSMHTHACVWPTGGFYPGAIDSCYASGENIGICFPSYLPTGTWIPRIGTIMSYCHLTAPQGGISFTQGFGPLPGDTIRLRYNQAPCLERTLNSSENPLTFDLMQNYPNPFNPGTSLKFAVPHDANITLRVYDINGREIAELVSGRFYEKGIHTYYFDSQRYSLSSGIYFYQLGATDPSKGNQVYTEVKKMILIK